VDWNPGAGQHPGGLGSRRLSSVEAGMWTARVGVPMAGYSSS